MIFEPMDVDGAYIVDLEPFEDERGFFARAWCEDEFAEKGLRARFVQMNVAHSGLRGTLRGLHFQEAPWEEAKFVRCIRGAIYDVVVDVRPSSSTFAHWASVELSAENRRAVYVPEGCAHGYQTLSDATEVLYQVSQRYHPSAERGVRWDDPTLKIRWPEVAHRTVSAKDASWPDLEVAGARERG